MTAIEIGNFLNDVAKKKGYTIYRTEQKSGLQRNQIKRIYNAPEHCTIESLIKIAYALGYDVELKERT